MPWLPRLKSHKPLIMDSCKTTRQTKTIISPVPQWLWPLNLIEWWLTLNSSTYLTLWSCSFAGSCYKLKPFYIQYYRFYDHQTWQEDDLLWWLTPIIIVTWAFDYAVCSQKVTREIKKITVTIAMPITIRVFIRVVTYHKECPPINFHYPQWGGHMMSAQFSYIFKQSSANTSLGFYIFRIFIISFSNPNHTIRLS